MATGARVCQPATEILTPPAKRAALLSTKDTGRRSNVTLDLPPREKRPRDCQPATEILTPPAKRAARQGAGRPKGSFGRKRMRALLMPQVERGQVTSARLGVRDISSAMLAASQEVDRHEKDWRPVFLKRQSNKGVRRKEALRKLAKHRSQLEKAALASAACNEGWEKGVEHFRAVAKECDAVAATFAGIEETMDVSHAQAGKLHTKANALRGVYNKLLMGVSKRQAFEESAEFLELAVGTVKSIVPRATSW
ncbi:unnamed protein product [Ectocarpus sp. 4 AP-2014]